VAHAKQPELVKPIFGLLYPDLDHLKRIEETIEERWGQIDLRSDPEPFTYTDYYAPEMGDNLLRSWCALSTLADPAGVGDWKIESNNIENSWAKENKRTINIDPGYISLPKLVLASVKDFSHRIYLGRGIYAEVTLIYRAHSFHGLPWTFPDYKDKIPMFNEWRNVLKRQLQEIKL